MNRKNNPESVKIAAAQNTKERDFWLNQLSGELVKTNFPYDQKEIGIDEYNIDSVQFAFTKEIVSKLMKLSKGSNHTLNLVLTAGVTLLLNKYTCIDDIIVGTPIYTQKTEGDFINTVLVLRNRIRNEVTFKEFLLQVKKTIMEAVENQNYPIETLIDVLNLETAGNGCPYFDIAVLLEEIHEKKYLHHIRCNMTFSFKREAESIRGVVEYNSLLYKKTTVERIIVHLINLFLKALFDVNACLSAIDILSEEEKKKLLNDFNNTGVEYPKDKTIHRLFEEQAEKTPGNIAVCSPVDLIEIYDRLKSEIVEMGKDKKLETCCFKANPYMYQADLELPGQKGRLKVLKTNRHNSVIVNNNMVLLLGLFDGQRNLESLYSHVKGLKDKNVDFFIYSMKMNDLLEISFQFNSKAEVFSAAVDGFEDFVKFVKSIYRNYLVELVDVSAEKSFFEDSFCKEFEEGQRFQDEIILENILIKDKELSKAEVLLLGDTPGIPTTGLLYLASYLRRKGVKAYCQFYDSSTDYAAMRRNIEGLLDRIQPKVVAVSLKWFLYIARVIDMCKIVKEYSRRNSLEIKVVVGGNTASYYWEKIMKYNCIDYLVRGDGEEALLGICRGNGKSGIPNCVYRKNGKIIENPVRYIQDETNSSEIYLSHLDEIMISNHAARFGTFFIYTHKGCAMNCLYCGGCSRAQQKTFNRKSVFRRGVEETRKDIFEAAKFTSTFHFEFDIPDENLQEYCRRIWEAIDLSSHFCVFSSLLPPAPDLIELVVNTFKYVYWDFDVCTLSERHRKQLFSMGLVKPQPSDKEILDFMSQCERYRNIEVRLNLITGLPYFALEDIEPSEALLTGIMNTYSCFGELHWARLHAQPGAPIIENAGKHSMHSYATTFEDFLKSSEESFNSESIYSTVENFNYPYIYFNDDRLNSEVTKFYLEINKKVDQCRMGKNRDLIVCNSLTYRQLNEKADQLAGELIARGVGPGKIVGLMIERTNEIPVGILAILKAGGAYLPIDPDFPAERVEYMLNDSSAAALITTPELSEGIAFKNEIIDISLDKEDEAFLTRPTHPIQPNSNSPVYIVYTSGTSGKPKGVLLKHENLVNYVNWFTEKTHLTEEDKTILTSSFAFDLGYTSLYTSLLNGGELHILPRDIYLLAERLLDYIRWKRITYIKMTPSLFSTIVNSPGFAAGNCKTLRLAAIGGEAINVKDIGNAHSICSHLQIMNHYGPTEATIGCVATFIDFDRFEKYKEHPVIGRPIYNANAYILGKGLNLLPVGVSGELCIAGACLGRGYLNRPELTAEKFTSLLLYPSTSLYRTGDLARLQPDGNIEFLGRIDNQVKVRGYRIELGEIENRLQKHRRVEDAVVVVKESSSKESSPENGDKFLCAYIVPKVGTIIPITQAGEDKKILRLKDILQADSQKEALEQSVITRFERVITENRGKIAVESDGQSLTYESLNRYANRVAQKISGSYDDRYKLSKNERVRYKRQMLLHGWGAAAQEKLKSTTVFVAGAGGGASPTVMQLALLGIGTIKVCDFDEVELSNLNRQFLHNEERLGMNKALSAQVTVSKTNPHVKVIPYTQKLTRENVSELVGDVDIIFDMFDGPADKFVLSEYAVVKGIPHVIISMTDINAYTAVFHPPTTPCYHCIFDKEKLETIVSGMQKYVENYTKNPLAVVGTSLFISTGAAVNEALKILLGFKSPAYNKFFYFNQRGEDENLVFTPGYKAMTHLFSDHFLRLCKEQGFDWDIGWRGNFLEELTITSDTNCTVCGIRRKGTQKIPEEQMTVTKEAAISMDIKIEYGKKGDEKKQLQTVALLLDNDINMAIGNIGTLKTGKTLVLLDPVASTERLIYVLEDSEARIILTDSRYLKLAEKLKNNVNKNIKIINIDRTDEFSGGKDSIKTDLYPENIVFMLYSPDSEALIKEFYDVLLNGAGPYIIEKNRKEKKLTSLSSELRAYLLKELPDYMIPSHFVQLDEIPLTPNSKVDVNALPDPDTLAAGKDLVAPRNKVEEKFTEIWSEVLGIEKDAIGINSNFFQSGGHSLNATIMVTRLHKELNVKLPLAQVFKTPTIEELAEFAKGSQKNNYTSIQPVEEKEYYPVSSAQKRMFLLNLLKDENDISDNTPNVLIVEGRLDVKRFEKAIKQLIKRHESLRTSFDLLDDVPIQRVHKDVDFKIEYYEYSHFDKKKIIQNFIRPFDLEKAPLLRVGLAKISAEKHLLMYDMHHIVIDDTSSDIFIREFTFLYEGVKLPPLRVQYKDFTLWQNERLQPGVIKKQEEYWLSVFSGEIPVLNMPTDFPRPTVQSFEGDSMKFQFNRELTEKIRRIMQESGVTLYMVLLAIYTILLSRYSGQEEIVVGTPIVGRPHADLENLIGMFVNTLAIRIYPRGELTFLEYLEDVKSNTLKAFDNQDFQFEDLVAKLGIKPGSNRNPLFDTMVAPVAANSNIYSNIDPENPVREIKDLVFRPSRFIDRATQFDIIIHPIDREDGIAFYLRYSTKLFKRKTIEKLLGHFEEISGCIASNKKIKLKDIKISHVFSDASSRILKEAADGFAF